MSEKLKPCPFCGGDVRIVDMDNFLSVIRAPGERGCSCRVFMESALYQDDEGRTKAYENLVEKWNKRDAPVILEVSND